MKARTSPRTNLFPVVAVGQRGGKIVEFGAEAFLEYATERAPGANIQEVNYGHTGADYALIQNALAGKVPIELLEEAGAVPGIDLGRTAILNTMQAIQRGIEIKAAGIATKAASYDSTNKLTLSGSSQWSHADSTPAKAVETAKEAIATGIGRDPNVLVLGQRFSAYPRSCDSPLSPVVADIAGNGREWSLSAMMAESSSNRTSANETASIKRDVEESLTLLEYPIRALDLSDHWHYEAWQVLTRARKLMKESLTWLTLSIELGPLSDLDDSEDE